MKEVIDGDEKGDGADEDIFAELSSNKHLPDFDFNKYPLIEEEDAMNSPRIKDEAWGNYEA